LFGGIATGIGVFILYLLLAGDASAQNIVTGLLIGGAVGTWVRLADL
jgi:multisubunit Na+/H+ antiporter MnhE subunit